MEYERMIRNILEDIGGKENINDVYNCATRLRFKLKDKSIIKKDELESVEGVISVVDSGGQIQLVIGQHVSEVYKELIEIANLNEQEDTQQENAEENNQEKQSIFEQFFDVVSGVFTPILGILTATGVIKGLLALITTLNILNETSGTFQVLEIAGDSFFFFLPMFLGYSAMKKFGGTPFLGMALGAALIHPNVAAIMDDQVAGMLFNNTFLESTYQSSFLGIPIIFMDYASSVIPIIITTYFAAKFEMFLRPKISKLVRTFIVPMFVILVFVPLSFLIIGPMTTFLSTGIGEVTLAIYNFSPTILGFLYGALIQVLVIFGLHWGFVAISITNISTIGYDPVTITGLTAGFALAGAVLMVMIQQKDTKMKQLGIPSFISSLMGITEPAVYSVTLPLKRPFVLASIASGIGGAIMGFAGVRQYSFGANGIFGFLNVINPKTGWDATVTWTIIACLVSFVSAVILMYFFGKPKSEHK